MLRRGRMGKVPLAVPTWGDPPGPHAGEDQARHDRLVAVAGNEQSAVCPAGYGQHCGPHRQRASARGEEGRLGADGVGHQVLRARQILPAGHSVVEAVGGEQIIAKRVLTQHGQDAVVDTGALAVPRRTEAVAVASVVVDQRVQQWCLRLIHGGSGTQGLRAPIGAQLLINRSWPLLSEDFPPHVLRQYALLADGERGVLVGPRGDYCWMCLPRWHDGAVFNSLLGGAGVYAVAPDLPRFVWGGYYEPRSLIWRSRWVTTDAIVECREALALPADTHTAVLLRRIHVIDGQRRMRIALDVRADFGTHVMSDVSCAETDGGRVWSGRSGPYRFRWTGADNTE